MRRMNRAHLKDAEFIRYINEEMDRFLITNYKPADKIWDVFKNTSEE